jgi:predicted adenine nucleotide alpha hydrolase (AANH) superfamily ATPase
MEEGFIQASNLGFEYFTTIMTISSRKDSQVLNQIGQALQNKYPKVKYFYSDFKKNHGLEIGESLCKKYCLYRQNYCGCKFSLQGLTNRQKLSEDKK